MALPVELSPTNSPAVNESNSNEVWLSACYRKSRKRHAAEIL